MYYKTSLIICLNIFKNYMHNQNKMHARRSSCIPNYEHHNYYVFSLYVSGLDVLGQSPRHNISYICTFIELPCYLNCLLKLHILC